MSGAISAAGGVLARDKPSELRAIRLLGSGRARSVGVRQLESGDRRGGRCRSYVAMRNALRRPTCVRRGTGGVQL